MPDKRTFFDKTFAAAAAQKGSKNLFFGKNFCVLSTYLLYNYIICRARESERKFLRAKRHKQGLTVRFVVFFQLTLTLQPHIFVFYQDKAFLLNGFVPSSRILPEFRRGISERRLTDRRSPFPLFCSARHPARSVLPFFQTIRHDASPALRRKTLACRRALSRFMKKSPVRKTIVLRTGLFLPSFFFTNF